MSISLIPLDTSSRLTYKNSAVSYAAAHDAASGTIMSWAFVTNSRAENGKRVTLYYYTADDKYWITRLMAIFDTSPLDGRSVSAAYVTWPHQDRHETNPGHSNPTIVEGTFQTPPVPTDWAVTTAKTLSGGSIDFDHTDEDTVCIVLNATGLDWLNPAGDSKLCIRLAGDIADLTPTDNNVVGNHSSGYVVDNDGHRWSLAVDDHGATEITATGAKVTAVVKDNGTPPILVVKHSGASLTYPRFRVRFSKSPTGSDPVYSDYASLDNYPSLKMSISGLDAETTYYYSVRVEFTADSGDEESLASGSFDTTGGVVLEIAFGQSPFSDSLTWTDVSGYMKSLATKRGRQHELERVEAGVATFYLDNAAGDWWRWNTVGAFYPNVKPLAPLRLSYVYDGVVYRLWWGVIERLKPGWIVPGEAGMNPEIALECVDMFKSFNRYRIVNANPAMTSEAAAGQKDVEVASVWGLFAGQSIKVYDDNNSELNYIASIDSATLTVTMLNNLSYAYSASKGYLKKFPAVLSGTRINDVVYELGWPIAQTSIDAGQVTIAEFTPPTGGTNCLEHLRKVTETESGVMFMRAADGYYVFQDQAARAKSPFSVSQMTFKDDDTDSKYVHPELVDDDTFIYNEADISGTGIDNHVTRNVTAQALQGPRVYSMKNSMFTLNSDALNRAWITVARFSDSIIRVNKLVVKPAASPADLFPKLMDSDISTRVTFQLNSAINPAVISRDYHIEGIEIEWDAKSDEWVVKWQLWDVNQYRIARTSDHDGWVVHTDNVTYQILHDAAAALDVYNDTGTWIEAGQRNVYALVGGAWVSGEISRGYMEFDTSILAADDEIAEAILMCRIHQAFAEGGGWDLVLVDPDTVAAPLVDTDYGDLEPRQTSLGSLAVDGTAGWAFIYLNSAGIAHVNKGGVTKFALRSQDDIDADHPGGTGQIRDYVTIYAKGTSYEPQLIIRIA